MANNDCSETDPDCRTLRTEAQQQGVSDPDNQPFMLCPPGAKAAALLVHGFTATPWEMRLLGEFLSEAGIASLAVRLPGHGTTPEDLADCRWQEWLNVVLNGYEILAKNYSSVYGMGMSTGCLLLLATAKTKPLKGLILFSPYLRVLHKLAPFAGWLRWVRPYQEKAAGGEESKRYYQRRPVAGMHQINLLIKAVRGVLTELSCPVLAFNGEGDQTVDIDSGREVVDAMKSAVKVYKRYGPEVPHVLTREENPCHKQMFAQTLKFMKEIERTENSG